MFCLKCNSTFPAYFEYCPICKGDDFLLDYGVDEDAEHEDADCDL